MQTYGICLHNYTTVYVHIRSIVFCVRAGPPLFVHAGCVQASVFSGFGPLQKHKHSSRQRWHMVNAHVWIIFADL